MKTTIKLILGGVVIAAGLFAAYRFTDLFDFIKKKPLTIDDTANVVSEIKKLGEFTTACYYEEMAIRDSYKEKGKFLVFNTTSENEILLIGKGIVRAGFDLSKITENDLRIKGDTIEVNLPQPEIFDIIMNPSDFTTEYESGTWTHEMTKPIKVRAKSDLEKNAYNFGIIKKAEESGIKRLEALFKTFGFQVVLLNIKQENTAETPASEKEALKEKNNKK